MVIRQLVYLVALAREKHFGRAAEACHVSQPGLSTALRQLEEELEVPIILRTQRFKGFTPQGEIVLSFARRVLAESATMRQQLLAGTKALEGKLTIGVVPSVMPMLPLLTGPLCKSSPNISIEALSMPESEIERMLVEFELDIGFTLLNRVSLPNLRTTQPLYYESYVFLTPNDGAYANFTSISWKEAANNPLALLKDTIHTRQAINREFAAVNCDPTPQVETDSILSLCSHVCSGNWSTILPKSYLHPFGPPQGTVALTLKDSKEVEPVGLIMLDRQPLPPVIQAMIDVSQDQHVLTELRKLNEVPAHEYRNSFSKDYVRA
ncbi:LysR family transcriptional regulator [Pusillimonas sp.]|uniref:LysR family transcriptional regulator n=1 Tax=Pusillimonas sp. TaxID=3040095 RepID=UPI0037C5D933